MTDRELLEYAAKAAGYALVWGDKYKVGDDEIDCTDIPYIRSGQPDEGDVYWNPLTDDGDALRLFCALPWLCIETSDVAATVRERGNPDEPSRVYFMWTEWLDKHNGDLAAATRRAIVRAYADIGRAER